MTVEQCALVLCTSTDAYLDLECRPGLLRLVEVGALIRAFDEEGKRLTRAAMRELQGLRVTLRFGLLHAFDSGNSCKLQYIALCDILQFAKYRKI